MIETSEAESRWSLTSTTWGASPGARVVDITVRAETCETARTVAAQIQGPPKMLPAKLMTLSRTMSCEEVDSF